jgi:hypothetical protein
MKTLNLNFPFFYEEPDGSTGGAEPTGEPMKPATPAHAEPTRLRTKPTSAKDFLSKSKLVKTEGVTADGTNVVIPGQEPPAPAAPAAQPPATPQEPQPKPGEGATNEPGEVIVAGPGATPQQPISEPDPNNANVPTGDGVTVPGMVKIGDQQYTVEQVNAGIEALTKAEESEEQRKTWQGNLTKKSQIVSGLTDQQVQEILPYAASQRKLPENLKDELVKMEKFPETFTITDSQGYENEYRTEDLPDGFLNDVANAVLAQKWPEYAEIIQERDRLKADNEKITTSVTQEQYSRGEEMSIEFMKGHPDAAITLRKGDVLKNVLGEIMRSGDTHPEYENAVRYATLLKAVHDGFMPDLNTAYDIMASGNKLKANAAAQVLNNQGNANMPETPDGQVPKKDPGREFLNKKRNVKGQKIMKLGR